MFAGAGVADLKIGVGLRTKGSRSYRDEVPIHVETEGNAIERAGHMGPNIQGKGGAAAGIAAISSEPEATTVGLVDDHLIVDAPGAAGTFSPQMHGGASARAVNPSVGGDRGRGA